MGWEFEFGDWMQLRLGSARYAAFEAWYICVYVDQIHSSDFVFIHPQNIIAFHWILTLHSMKMVGVCKHWESITESHIRVVKDSELLHIAFADQIEVGQFRVGIVRDSYVFQRMLKPWLDNFSITLPCGANKRLVFCFVFVYTRFHPSHQWKQSAYMIIESMFLYKCTLMYCNRHYYSYSLTIPNHFLPSAFIIS